MGHQHISTRVGSKKDIPDDVQQYTAMTVDHVGDRRVCLWISTAIGIPPFAALAILHKVGMLRYDPDSQRILAYDFQRSDYVEYSAKRRLSWWNTAWDPLVKVASPCRLVG